MTLTAGDTLAHYRISAAIGVGGMGEVYRATDTKLGREVAIKVLPGELALDAGRLARFEREAKLLAALNHPNIAHVYGFESATLDDGSTRHFLAMELVEGEDLGERLKRGPIPVDEALAVAGQIADALEEAHGRGIVHRDLKPANVQVTPDGTAKVLDFGLARADTGDSPAGSGAELSQSPTLAHTGTQAGIILGTAGYMSPEQASGRRVDERADIWAFGVVLFEMLTGERLFEGHNVSEILASILKEEPPWERLPADTPRSLDRLLRRCLHKKPRERLRHIGDARLEVEEARRELSSGPAERREPGVPSGTGRERLGWVVAAVLALGAAGLAMGWSLSRGPSPEPVLLSVPLDPAGLDGRFAVSPLGSQVAFVGREEKRDTFLYLRDFDAPEARVFPGSDRAWHPFFSPDGEWIAFLDQVSALKKVPVRGGPVVTVARGNFRNSVGAWTEDGWILLTQPVAGRPGQLVRVHPDGGPIEAVPTSDENAREPIRSVAMMPGSHGVLVTVDLSGVAGEQAVAFQDLETGERRVLARGSSEPRYLASGHVVYWRAGGLMAERLDVTGPELAGSPVPLQAFTGAGEIAWFDVSPDGTLVFLKEDRDEGRFGPSFGSGTARFARVSRDGLTTLLAGEVATGWEPRLSPDGLRLVKNHRDDVWVMALDRGTLTRISSAPGEDETGAWSPDGRWIAWAGAREEQRALLRRRSDGSGGEERLWSDARHFHVASWTAAGIVVTVDDPETGWDVLLVDPDPSRETRSLLGGRFNEESPRVSPDGRLLAFVSDETGRKEVYVQAFPEAGTRVQASLDGGVQPVWRPGTRELLYRGSGKIMAVTLDSGSPPAVSEPREVLDDRFAGLHEPDHTSFAVERDGGLLGVEEPDRPAIQSLRIALDWTASLGLDR